MDYQLNSIVLGHKSKLLNRNYFYNCCFKKDYLPVEGRQEVFIFLRGKYFWGHTSESFFFFRHWAKHFVTTFPCREKIKQHLEGFSSVELIILKSIISSPKLSFNSIITPLYTWENWGLGIYPCNNCTTCNGQTGFWLKV